MASGAVFVGPVSGEQLRQSQFARGRFILGKSGNIRRRRRNPLAEQAADDPVTSFHRTGPQARRVGGQEYRHRREAPSAVTPRVFDSNPFVGTDIGDGDSVVLGQDRVDERVIGVEEIKHRAISLNDIDEKANRFLIHRLSKFVCKAGKPAAIDAVVLFETAKIEPIAAEFDREGPHAIVAQHSSRLSEKDFRSAKVARGGMAQEFLVGHGRPKEVAQTARQSVIGQRTRRFARLARIEAEVEVRRHQHGRHQVANRVLVAQFVLLRDSR